MDFSKLNLWTILSFGAFVYFWVMQPIIQLFVEPLSQTANIIITIVGCTLTLYVVLNALFISAEPYEIDRLKRIGCFIYAIRPKWLEVCVLMIGYTMARMASIGLTSVEEPIYKMQFLMVMLASMFLIILATKWYTDTINWRYHIEGYRIPKSDWL